MTPPSTEERLTRLETGYGHLATIADIEKVYTAPSKPFVPTATQPSRSTR